jgi:hypothetical protein
MMDYILYILCIYYWLYIVGYILWDTYYELYVMCLSRCYSVFQVWHYIYVCITALSCMVFFCSHLPVARTTPYLSTVNITQTFSPGDTLPFNDKLQLMFTTDPVPALVVLDGFCILVFTLELVLNAFVFGHNRSTNTKVLFLLSVATVLIMIVTFGLEFRKDLILTSIATRVVFFIIKCLTGCRALFFFRLERDFGVLKVLHLTVRNSCQELLLTCLTFMFTAFMFASFIYYSEIMDSTVFPNFTVAMWWAVVSMSTVGYGDTYPKSVPGYVVGCACAMIGMLILALPIAIVVSNFSEYYSHSKDYQSYLAASSSRKSSEEKHRRKH